MGNYYLDIETTGLNPDKDKIISIQFQELNRNTGEPVGPLTILKEWESSENDILYKFANHTPMSDNYAFSFVPVGYNLQFENDFFKKRFEVNNQLPVEIIKRPNLDLKTVCVIMNRGEFKGSGLDSMTGKKHDGKIIPQWYKDKDYDKIEEYIRCETQEFVKFNAWLYRELPQLYERFS